jgi:hypothetical protein
MMKRNLSAKRAAKVAHTAAAKAAEVSSADADPVVRFQEAEEPEAGLALENLRHRAETKTELLEGILQQPQIYQRGRGYIER